jgi:thymidylate kinase
MIGQIFIDGMDCAGKDTIKSELKKRTNCEYVISGRGPVGYLAYSLLFDKGFDNDRFIQLAESMQETAITFLIQVSEQNTLARSLGRGEKPADLFKKNTTYEQNLAAFNAAHMMLISTHHIVVVDNNADLESTINFILNKIQEIESE